jgi:PAS domain-containing protein
MPGKPSYEELEQRVTELEWEAAKARKAEQTLREHEQMLSQIIQASPTPTFVIDRNHTIAHCNKAFENLLGVPADDMVEKPRKWLEAESRDTPYMADFIVDQAPEEEMLWYYGGKCRKSPVAEGAYEAEAFFPKLGENGSWLFLTAAPLKDANGNLIGGVETLQDVTERRLAEEGLRESEKRLAQIVQGSSIPTFVINERHLLTHCNRAYEKLTKIPAGTILGTHAYWVTFYSTQRPVMADFIVDRTSEEEMRSFYGEKLRKSEVMTSFPTLTKGANGFFSLQPPSSMMTAGSPVRLRPCRTSRRGKGRRKRSENRKSVIERFSTLRPTPSSCSHWRGEYPT